MHNKPNYIKTSTETKHSITLTIKKATNTYLNRLISLKCAPDLLALGLFPNAKEVTESFAAYKASCKYVPFNRKDPTIDVFVVGDGGTPRTAATFALQSGWRCYSIDPNLNINKIHHFERNIRRLFCVPVRVQDTSWFGRKAVIVMPHTHVSVEDTLKRFAYDEIYLIVNPCCMELTLPPAEGTLIAEYDDWGIHSEKRTIRVYHIINSY